MEQSIGLVVLLGAIFVLACLLPFVASFVIDTSVSAGLGKGVLLPILVGVASLVLLVAGSALWTVGMQLTASTPALAEWAPVVLQRMLVLILSFSIPLSIVAGSLRAWCGSTGPLDLAEAERRESVRIQPALPAVSRLQTAEPRTRQSAAQGDLISAQSAA